MSKPEPRAKKLDLPQPKEIQHHVDGDSATSTRAYRGYSVVVRGEIPRDIKERISKLHASALVKSVHLKGKEPGCVNGRPNAEPDGASDQH